MIMSMVITDQMEPMLEDITGRLQMATPITITVREVIQTHTLVKKVTQTPITILPIDINPIITTQIAENATHHTVIKSI